MSVLYIRSVTPLLSRSSPSSTNSGIEVSRKSFMIDQSWLP